MLKKQIVKKTSLFTLILAFMVTTVAANASVMNNEKGKHGEISKTEQVKTAEKTTFKAWYNIDDPDNPSVYGAPITAPDLNNPNDCAQNNNTDLCAVELEVPDPNYEFTSSEPLGNLPSGISETGLRAHKRP